MPKYDPYKKAWEKRRRKTADRNRRFSIQVREDARRIADHLGSRYGVKRVFLFGSILEEEKFNENSDLDMAVVGMKKADFYKALADISQMTEFNIDLKPLEDCAESFRKRVKEEGELIYERR